MMAVTNTQVGLMIDFISTSLNTGRAAAEVANDIETWTETQRALNKLIAQYDLQGGQSPCLRTITLS